MTTKQLISRVRDTLVGGTVVDAYLVAVTDLLAVETISIPVLRLDNGTQLFVAIEIEDADEAVALMTRLREVYSRALIESVEVRRVNDRQSICVFFQERVAFLQLRTVIPKDGDNGNWHHHLHEHPLTNKVTRILNANSREAAS